MTHMGDWSDRVPHSQESFSPEELRLAELFDQADRLAEDAQALDRFLDSLDPEDRAEVVSALACANALRMAGSESPPEMTGTAWDRILAALYPEPSSDSAPWDFLDHVQEAVERARRDHPD